MKSTALFFLLYVFLALRPATAQTDATTEGNSRSIGPSTAQTEELGQETESSIQISGSIQSHYDTDKEPAGEDNKGTVVLERAIIQTSVPINENFTINIYADRRVVKGRGLFSEEDDLDERDADETLGANVVFTTSELGLPITAVFGKFDFDYVPIHDVGPLSEEEDELIRGDSMTGAVLSVEIPNPAIKEFGKIFLSGAILNSPEVREREDALFETSAVEYRISISVSDSFIRGLELGFNYSAQEDEISSSKLKKIVFHSSYDLSNTTKILGRRLRREDGDFWHIGINHKLNRNVTLYISFEVGEESSSHQPDEEIERWAGGSVFQLVKSRNLNMSIGTELYSKEETGGRLNHRSGVLGARVFTEISF